MLRSCWARRSSTARPWTPRVGRNARIQCRVPLAIQHSSRAVLRALRPFNTSRSHRTERMVLEKLGSSLQKVLRKIAGASHIDEALIKEVVRYFQKKGLTVGVVAADTHRPAAYDQLKQLADSIKVSFYGDRDEKSAVNVTRAGMKALEAAGVVIVDTSGRHALEADLIEEIRAVSKVVQPDETILLPDAPPGHQAGPQAKG